MVLIYYRAARSQMVLGALLDRLLGQMDEHLGFIPTDPVNRAGRYQR